jgi:glycerol uptake facilitator-like aquaporin
MAKHTYGHTFGKQLTLLFIGLKLTHNIDWAWILIIAPFWASVVLYVLIDRITGNAAKWLMD